MKSLDLDRSVVETAYARWAPIYDAVCGPVMVKGRRAAAAAARAVGGKILEVGVGTGLSFDDYDASTEITGIDLCAPMLAKAREKMASGRYPHVKDVRLMDAHQMTFADATFDCVVAQFVITLVANPEQVLSECHRVVKPGGRIILKSRPPAPVAIDLAAALRKEVVFESVSYATFAEALEFLTRHDLADLFGKPRPLGDFADVFATDDVGERLKSFLSPGSGDANWAPSRHIDKDEAVPVTAGE